MGFWGPGLYQNDTAADVKGRVTEYWQQGSSGEEIISRIREDFSDLTEEVSPDGAFLWLGLADSLWRLGLLTEDIRDRAMAWIDRKDIIDTIPDPAFNPNMEKRRTIMLNKLKDKLSSPQPQVRKYVSRVPRSCGWQNGDAYAYRIKGENAEISGLAGRFLILRQIEEITWDSKKAPLIYVKITNNQDLPVSTMEYDSLEYIQVWATPYEDRFFPIDFRRPAEDIAEKSRIKYEVDEYGYLAQYRVVLLQMTKKALHSDLTYIGNFIDARPPEKEYVPHVQENNILVSWRKNGEEFEERMIHKYCAYNLRQLEIFHDQPSG